METVGMAPRLLGGDMQSIRTLATSIKHTGDITASSACLQLPGLGGMDRAIHTAAIPPYSTLQITRDTCAHAVYTLPGPARRVSREDLQLCCACHCCFLVNAACAAHALNHLAEIVGLFKQHCFKTRLPRALLLPRHATLSCLCMGDRAWTTHSTTRTHFLPLLPTSCIHLPLPPSQSPIQRAIFQSLEGCMSGQNRIFSNAYHACCVAPLPLYHCRSIPYRQWKA